MNTTELVLLTRLRRLTESGAAQAVRLNAGLSLNEVAGAVGCQASTILRWEKGHRVPHGSKAIVYLELLEGLLAGTRPRGRKATDRPVAGARGRVGQS